MSGDEVIKLAKSLAMMLKCIAEEVDIDLDDTTISVKSDEQVIASINAGDIVRKANALKYGSIEEDE